MYHFIANPNARSGQGLALWEKIKLKLIAEHIDYQIHFTHHRHHATEIAAELTASGDPVTIVVLGGDGSVDEVICGLQNLSLVTLGYIPIGSGNDFGRGLALPSDTMKALDLVLHSEQTRKINLGVLHYHDKVHRLPSVPESDTMQLSAINFVFPGLKSFLTGSVWANLPMQPAHSTVCAAVSQMRWKSFWTIPKDFILNGFSLPLHLIFLMKVVDANSARMPNRMMICWTLL